MSILRKMKKNSLDETTSESSKKRSDQRVKLVDRDPDHKIILIAADSCANCEYIFNWYYDNIHRSGNQVVITYVIELPEQKTSSRGMHISPKTLQELWKKEEEKTIELEQTMRRLLKQKRCSGILRTAAGKPGPTVCKVALEEGASIVVTGTRNLGRMKRVLIGSVSDYLVHHCVSPVVVCRLPNIQRSTSEVSSSEFRQRHFSDSAMLSGKGTFKRASFIERMRHKSAGHRPIVPKEELELELEEEKENTAA